MMIAVASGKGGTGKTTVATSLALSVDGAATLFLDCDAEAPNAHLFLEPAFEHREDVAIPIPRINEARCTYCGRCAEVCQYHAIAIVDQNVIIFPELCHGCGGCALSCSEGAITEVPHVIGAVEAGPTGNGLYFARGVLNVGQPMAVPIIRRLKHWAASRGDGHEGNSAQTVIIDVPPGASCPVVQSVRGADFLVLVTEPTPFGLHDLWLMTGVAEELEIRAGVVVNRDGVGDAEVDRFCAEAGLPILMRIPLDRRIAAGMARGEPLIQVLPEYAPRFQELYADIATRVG